MTYRRVVPRDLFNEGDLLKCYGRVWILLQGGAFDASLGEGEGDPFDIQQDESDGSLSIPSLPFTIRGAVWRLWRPLNSREPWPLRASSPDEEQTVDVFTADGHFSQEFLAVLSAGAP
jgi:hypothetical protein